MVVRKSTLLIVCFFLLLFTLFVIRGVFMLDPDLGWHIRMGQLILQHGIPITDQLSYTMPSYAVIDHEWLTNVILAGLYPLIGKIGLAFMFSAFAIGALLVQYFSLKQAERIYSFIPFLLGGIDLFGFVGVRPQVITWLFFSFFVSLMLHTIRWQRYRFVVPLLMFVWVNLHGGFAYGIAIIVLFTFFSNVQKRRLWTAETAVLLLTILVTFLNPYGWRIWYEIWMQGTDANLHWSIFEWLPAIFSPDAGFWFLIVISGIFVWRCRKQIPVFHILLYCVFAFAAISSVRNIPLWLFVVLPLLPGLIGYFAAEAAQYPFGKERFRIAYRVFSGILVTVMTAYVLLLLQITFLLTEQAFYPSGAVVYLQKHKTGHHIFSSQEWNGYLVWHLPGERVFIHGMMPSWRDHHVSGESVYAFRDYQDILLGKASFLAAVRRYDIDTVVIPSPQRQPGKNKSVVGQLAITVQKAGWKKVYEDAVAVIYQKL